MLWPFYRAHLSFSLVVQISFNTSKNIYIFRKVLPALKEQLSEFFVTMNTRAYSKTIMSMIFFN